MYMYIIMALLGVYNLSDDQLASVGNLYTVIYIRSDNGYIDGFTITFICILIEGIATSYACV